MIAFLASLALAASSPSAPAAEGGADRPQARQAPATARASGTATVRIMTAAVLRDGVVEGGGNALAPRATTIEAAPGIRREALLVEFL